MKHIYIITSCLLLLSLTVHAQFSIDPAQPFAICNASDVQNKVHAFSVNGSDYLTTWIDKRNGSAGSALYIQHLDSSGVPLLSANGQAIYTTVGKEIWAYDIAPWQNGFLIAWLEGGFGLGGDSLFCDYIDASGNHLWNQPVNVSNKTASVIYVSGSGLKVMPNDSGAFITYSLTYGGGADVFSFNRIDFAGNLHWPINNFSITLSGYIAVPQYDNHNGFYVASCGGGIGSPIKMQHYGLDGLATFPTLIDMTQGAGGRSSGWNVICDADTNAYLLWDDNLGDIQISKTDPLGNLLWPTNFKTVCGFSGSQSNVDYYFNGNDIYVTWIDGRTPAANAFIYTQKLDTSGTAQWTTDGVLVSSLNSYIPYPKITMGANGNVVNTYLTGGAFRAQCLTSDSITLWQTDGIVVATNTAPFYAEYVLVSDPTGSVAAFWTDNSDIYGARVSPSGMLTNLGNIVTEKPDVYPNPASDQFVLNCKKQYSEIEIRISNISGQEIFSKNYHHNTSSQFTLSTKGLSSGLYLILVVADGDRFVNKLLVK